MTNDMQDFDVHDPDEMASPATFSVSDVAKGGVVFVVPIDAPIPSELADEAMPTGNLYQRLSAVGSDWTTGFGFCPIAGAELMHLDRAWRLLQVAKRVYVLMDIPGARYDIMFTQAARTIGLAKMDWPAIAEAIASNSIAAQRTKDAKPWQSDELVVEAQEQGSRRVPRRAQVDAQPLSEPQTDENPT